MMLGEYICYNSKKTIWFEEQLASLAASFYERIAVELVDCTKQFTVEKLMRLTKRGIG